MSKENILILLGVIVALAPFSGVPLSWLDIALPLIGLGIGLIGYFMRPRKSTASALGETEATA